MRGSHSPRREDKRGENLPGDSQDPVLMPPVWSPNLTPPPGTP